MAPARLELNRKSEGTENIARPATSKLLYKVMENTELYHTAVGGGEVEGVAGGGDQHANTSHVLTPLTELESPPTDWRISSMQREDTKTMQNQCSVSEHRTMNQPLTGLHHVQANTGPMDKESELSPSTHPLTQS